MAGPACLLRLSISAGPQPRWGSAQHQRSQGHRPGTPAGPRLYGPRRTAHGKVSQEITRAGRRI